MNNEEKILEILGSMQNQMNGIQTQLNNVDARLSNLETKVDELTEAHDETRTAVNIILEWTEKVSSAIQFPLPRI